MKAFSFSSILKNFGKQLSSLASQMPWCNLRFILGSMSVLSRVSRPFSRTSFGTSLGASFGTSRRASHFAAMIFAVLTLSVANIGMAWGADPVPASAGTYVINEKKPGSENKFYKLGSGVYIHRRNNSSWTDGSGMKTTSNNTNGVAVYLSSSMNMSGLIKKSSSKAEVTVQFDVYTLKNGPAAFNTMVNGTDNSTTASVELSLSVTYTTSVTFAALGSNKAEEKSSSDLTLAAGYYYIVPHETASVGKTFIYSITLSSAASCDSNPANPEGLAVGNITQGGATFTITDAANTNNYEIVCKTTSGAPAADATPTKTGTDKTLAITGLEDGTTYYAWVRSVCDASYKSGWVALGSGTFTTKSCSISECGNVTLTYPIYTSGDLSTSNLFSGATSSNATAVSVGASPAFTGVTVSAATKGSSANAGACYAKSTPLTGKMKYSASSKSSSYYIDFPFTVNTGYTFTPCDVQVVIQPVSSDQIFTVEITNGTNVYGTSTATLNAGVMEPIIGLTSPAEMSAGNYTIRLYPHGGSNKEFRMGANVILKGTTAASAPSCTAPTSVTISGSWDRFGGETISLTATPTGGSGNYTYQWQKKIGDNWNNIEDNATATTNNLIYENCDGSHSGTYRCVVSTGADCSTVSDGLQVKVYTLECYNNGTNIYHFTRNGNTQSGTLTLNLNANTAYEFKVHVDNTYYGNNGTINKDETNWVMCNSDNGGACANNLTVNSGLGGTFTFGIEYSTGGNSSVEGEPEISVTYPRKTIYLEPNSDWLSNSAKFAYYYFHKTGDDTDAEGWTDFLTADDCGRYADIPQWNGVQMIAVRFNSSKASTGNWDYKWNQTSDLTVTSNDLITITGWDNSQTYNSTYSTPTYTIGYAKGTPAASIDGSKADETKTCGVAFTLPNSAVFTRTGYTQTGWTTSDGGAQTHALGGSYTGNAAQTFYPVWTAKTTAITLDKNNSDPGSTDGSVTATYGSKDVSSLVHATRTGYTQNGYETSTGTLILKSDGTFDGTHSGYTDSKTWVNENAAVTLYARWTANKFNVTHTLSHVTRSSGGEAGSNKATYGTAYSVTFAASSGYTLPDAVTVTVGGSDVTANCTWNQGTGELTIPAAYVTGNIVITVTGAAAVVSYATSIDFEAIIDESGTSAAWKTTMEGRNYTLNQVDGSKWSLDGGNSGAKPADKGLKIKETGDNAGKITFTVRANQTVELKVGTLAGTNAGTAKFSINGGSSYSDITGAETASTGASVVTTYTGATDRTYVFKTSSADWNILQHIIIGYKITYDKGANGTGTIDPMYKTHGTNITLSSSMFIRDGYTQDGWSTSDGGSKVYELGASYTTDAPVTLYPHWVEDAATISATLESDTYMRTGASGMELSVSITGASSGWYYRVKNTSTEGYQTPDMTTYTTTSWIMTSTIGADANSYVVELYNGSGTKMATSNPITVYGETGHPVTIVAGANGTVSPSGLIYANGGHLHPEITATPASGYHFVNWTLDNSNATLANENAATTTITNASGACTITANFAADAPVATPMITYNLNVGTSASASIGTSGTSTDPSNITSIAISQANAAGDGAGASNRTTKLPLATGENAASVDNPDKYVLFTFNVACGKKLTPSEVKIKVANVGGTAGGYQNYKAVLSDAYGHSISNTFTGMNSDGTVEEFSITNGGGTYFQGNVTLKLWSCKGNDGNASAFRMGTPLTIYGVIGDAATPAATITWNTQPADGQVGSADFAYAVSCSDGSTVTVTSADPSIATIVDGKLHYEAAGTTHLVATATDACGNEITQNSNDFTVTAASVDPDPEPEPSGCITITDFDGTQNTSANGKPDANAKYLYGYTDANKTPEYAYTITTNKSNNVGKNDGAELYLYYGTSVNIYADNTTTGGTPQDFSGITYISIDVKMVKSSYYSSFDIKVGDKVIADDISLEGTAQSNYVTFEYNVSNLDGKVTIIANGSSTNHHIYVDNIEICTAALTPCTTPVLSDLENKKVCPGSDVTWTAIVNNTATLQENGETITYQWTKNSTVLSNDATLTLNDITEAAGGTYVVTATVSADGKASKTASKEVTLTVTPATATPKITANANTIYTGNDVTLTATCASSGVGYKWYTCTDADGNGESEIGEAENAEYTFTAGEAGTYYYKVIVTGDDTHSCGKAETIFPLVVSSSNSGQTTCAEIAGQFASGVYNLDTDFVLYGVNSKGNLDEGVASSQGTSRCGGEKGWFFNRQRFAVTFPVDVVSFSFMGYQATQRAVEAIQTTAKLLSENTEYQTIKYTSTVTKENNCQTFVVTPENTITAGTIVWIDLSNALNISEICYVPVSTADCTDPQVTATVNNVNNAIVCEGTENVTFTATNYANGAEFQWQKKDGNTWKDINGATSATYTISSVTTNHAGKYRVIAHNVCNRISEELTLTVLTAPEFNAFANTASVMKGNALTINDVEATNATEYTWYKSADNSFDVGADTKVGTTKELLLAASSITEEANQTFYLFCVASNSCGSVTSNAITVTVTPFVEEECATAGNEGEHEFGFTNTSCSQGTYSETAVWTTNSRSKYLTYTAPEGKYFKTAKVTVAVTSGSKCGYAYSTDGGTTWTYAELTSLSSTLTEKTINLSALGGGVIDAFRISRNLQDGGGTDHGVTSGNFHLSKACFEYADACTETTLAVGSYNNEHNISTNMDFVEPTFTLKSGETTLTADLTYSSSNSEIATVDEEGNVTFEGMTGKVTITVAFAGATINETEYCACQGSYTITVGCTDQAPTIKAATGTNLNGCNTSIILEAKMQDGTTAFADGTFQWYRDGEAIDGATSASYEVVRAGTYTVSRTYTCTTMSSNSAVVTNENPEPKVERLTPFQYYHVNKTYSNQMKDRHLFAVTSYGTLDGGKRYHLTATRNGGALDLSSSMAFFTIPSSDNAVDTVMIDLNELTNKYAEGDEIVITCAPINNCNTASAITTSITIHVIGDKPTLALICSGANGEGTRATKELVVGGDFLTGYNKADLCQQTGNKTFDATKEWGFYTELKEKYIVTPVNGYAEFNKLNYEPFDILLLTDYPKASKSEAAATILDDMAALCDYRPLLSLKAHMVAKSPSKWAAKGFTTSPVVPAVTSQYANIVCYAHPMFDNLDDAQKEGIYHDHDDFNQLVYKILTGPGHESGKGLQGFELKDADNFVTIGLIHYNAEAEMVTHTDGDDTHTHLKWTPAANDRQLVAIAERQANIEARMILFAINCGAQSKQTPMGRQVLLTCLDYLLKTDPIEVADCRLTFDNGEGNTNWGQSAYEGTGTKGDGLWSTAANWGPEYKVVPGRNNDVRIAAPCTVDANEVEVLSVHITENGSLTIPANSSLTARSTILRADENGNVYPTNVADISLGSNADGNASLILNNERGDTKAGVAMYSKAKAGTGTTWQYIGTPHSDVSNATYNYYDSWIYRWNPSAGWEVVPTGGAVYPWVGYCITHPELGHTYWMEGTLVETTTQEIEVPSNSYQIIGNSWTAPIQIANFEETDFEGIETKTIYFFNTGTDPKGEGSVTENATGDARWEAGTYIPVPIHSAEYTGEDTEIPSMQGFYVANNNPTSAGTLHLDYERHVSAPRKNTPSGPMHAPARINAKDDEPIVAKLLVRGKRYDDKLILLEREDFTGGYDSGWDGDKWDGGTISPTIWAVNEIGGADAVAAIPEFEGTVIGFRAGEDNIYTIHFDYDGMEEALYLLDTETKIYTRVLKGNSYTFACPDKAEHNRFILTRKAPQIATGTENIATGENAKAVKFIKDDKIFIFVNGILYDATGKMVIR